MIQRSHWAGFAGESRIVKNSVTRRSSVEVSLLVNFDQFFGVLGGFYLQHFQKGMCSVLKFRFLSQLQDVLLPAAKTAQPLLEQSTVDSTATSAWASRNGRKPTGILSYRVIAKIKGN